MSRKITSEQHDEAFRILRAEYYQAVRSIAEEALKIEGEGRRDDCMHSAVDGSSWTIYTNRALQVLLVSDNSHAFDEDGWELDPTKGLLGSVSTAAFAAMTADVRECMDALLQFPEAS